METAARLDPELAFRRGYLAYAYGLTGNTEKAKALIASLEREQQTQQGRNVALAVAYLGVGDNDKALSQLEAALNAHDISLLTVASPVPDRVWDPLRSNPRFDAILRRMNLYEYAHPPGGRS
jgi:tetratricopeptide (TPR) repeat protein